MAQPPAGSSLLFAALADSGRIKERKNGVYRMVLKGVDDIDWFTDRPDRVAGEWSPKRLVRKWDRLFSDGAGAPNAQMSYTWKSFIDFAGPIEGRGSMSFEMFKPTPNKKGNKLTFEVRGIGKKNKEIVAGLAGRDIENISLFIDDGTLSASSSNSWVETSVRALIGVSDDSQYNFKSANLRGANFSDLDLTGANLTGADLEGASLTNANLTNVSLVDANLANATLTGANLTSAVLGGVNLTNANLSNANLTNADISISPLQEAPVHLASFNNTNLTGANLTGANLDGALFLNSICPDGSMNIGASPCTASN